MSNTTKYADHADEFDEALGRFDAAEAAKDAKAGQDGAQDAQDAAQKPEQGVQAQEGADDGHEQAHEGAEGAEGAEGGHEAHEGADDGQDDAKSPNREAAKYRRRLRDAERERDELRGRLDVYLARDVEQVAAGFLDAPALLWADGKATAGDFLDDKGAVDRAKVKAASAALLERYGRGLASRRGTAPNEGRSRMSASGPFYRDAFAPKREI